VTQATGGLETVIAEGGLAYRVHTFASSGNLQVTESGTVEYLVVAGGGGGGGNTAGGGGAGGYLTGNLSVSAGTCVVTVGAGGAGGLAAAPTAQRGINGSISSITGGASAISATGGGGAAGWDESANPFKNGGSGAGRTGSANGISIGIGLGTAGQGNNGGLNSAGCAGGGGGAGTAGGNASDTGNGSAGAGGNGLISSISGTARYYAGGGGGGGGSKTRTSGATSGAAGSGGLGGGGAGTAGDQTTATAGTVNTGGGGGGGGFVFGSYGGAGGLGGSGVVIIRYSIGPVPLSYTQYTNQLAVNKFNFTPTAPVIAQGGTSPYSYSISPALPDGLLLASGNGAIYGTPTVTVANSAHTITITDSNATPRTTTAAIGISTSLSYMYSVDLVANKTLTITTEYGVSDSERRAASFNSPGLQVTTFDGTTGSKNLFHGNVLSVRTGYSTISNLGLAVDQFITSVDSGFENYLSVGGNFKTVYGNVQVSVSNFYLDSQAFGNTGTYSWTVPAGVTSISVAGVGGGGGGSQKSAGGTGGAGGQLKYVNNIPVTPGDIYTVVVGTGGTTGGAFGNTGGSTYMFKSTGNTTPILLAAGGRGGDSMYWTNENDAAATIYDAPATPAIYTFQAVSPVGQTIAYSVVSGTLPTGVTLNSSTGVLGGDPDNVVSDTSYSFTVAATTSAQTITRLFVLTVRPLPPYILSISPAYQGQTSWNLLTQGNLSITTANVSYSITAAIESVRTQIKVWGGGGGGTTSGGGIGGGSGYSTGIYTFPVGVAHRLIVGEGGGAVAGAGSRNAAGGGAGSGIEFAANSAPVIVAGGGGGSADSGRNGGAGGGASGQTGSGGGGAGPGGSQSAPGTGVSGGRRTGASGSGRNGGFGGTGSQGSRFAYGFGTGGWGSLNGGDSGSGGGGGGYFGGAEGGVL
jgi:hypothetical protein